MKMPLSGGVPGSLWLAFIIARHLRRGSVEYFSFSERGEGFQLGVVGLTEGSMAVERVEVISLTVDSDTLEISAPQ